MKCCLTCIVKLSSGLSSGKTVVSIASVANISNVVSITRIFIRHATV